MGSTGEKSGLSEEDLSQTGELAPVKGLYQI